VRLRPLTEAECYARCYGGFRTDQVSIVLPGTRQAEDERVALARSRALAERSEDRSAEAA
jgi:hypothetical protein